VVLDLEVKDHTDLNTASVIWNPGKEIVDPWAYSIARRYELFRYHKLKFTYHGTSSTDSPGRVCMIFDPDYQDPEPSSMIEAQQHSTSAASSLWDPMCSMEVPAHLLSPAGTNAKFVTDDYREDDYSNALGRFSVAVEGGNGEDVLSGFITCEYVVDLYAAQLHDSSIQGYAHLFSYTARRGGLFDNMGSTSETNLIDRGWTFNENTITVPSTASGYYYIVLMVSNADNPVSAASPDHFSTTGGVVLHHDFLSETGAGGTDVSHKSSAPSDAALSTYMLVCDIHVTGAGTLEYHTLGGVAVSGTLYMDLLVNQLPANHDLLKMAPVEPRIERKSECRPSDDAPRESSDEYISLADLSDPPDGTPAPPAGWVLSKAPSCI